MVLRHTAGATQTNLNSNNPKHVMQQSPQGCIVPDVSPHLPANIYTWPQELRSRSRDTSKELWPPKHPKTRGSSVVIQPGHIVREDLCWQALTSRNRPERHTAAVLQMV